MTQMNDRPVTPVTPDSVTQSTQHWRELLVVVRQSANCHFCRTKTTGVTPGNKTSPPLIPSFYSRFTKTGVCIHAYICVYIYIRTYARTYICMYVSGLMFTLCNTFHRNSVNVDMRFENIKFGSVQCKIHTFHSSYGVLYKLSCYGILQYTRIV